MPRYFQILLCGFSLVFFGLVGCDNSDPAKEYVASKNKTNIQKVANAYILYAALNRNKGPKSKDKLVGFVTDRESIQRNLDMMGIKREDFASYLVSSVDDKKFTVRWDLAFNPDGPAIPLVFDKKGSGGVRRVCLSDSRILEVEDEAKYQDLLAGKISKEDAGEAIWEGKNGEEDGAPEGE